MKIILLEPINTVNYFRNKIRILNVKKRLGVAMRYAWQILLLTLYRLRIFAE